VSASMSTFTWTGIILGGFALLYQVLVLLALFIWRQRNIQQSPDLSPVSIFKPLCGLEPCLYDNPHSFCQQDYPCFEIIFGFHSVDDPALAIAHRLQFEFQHLDIHMNASFIPSTMVGWMLGMRDFGFGSTLALPKSALNAIGGFAALDNHLADDYMLARLLRRQGLKTVISPLCDMLSFAIWIGSYFGHHIHWRRCVFTLQRNGRMQDVEDIV